MHVQKQSYNALSMESTMQTKLTVTFARALVVSAYSLTPAEEICKPHLAESTSVSLQI